MARLIGLLSFALALGFFACGAGAQETKKIDVDAFFKKLDGNNDGKLSKVEFLKLAEAYKDKQKAREKLTVVFDKIDPKNEGLSKDQFRTYIDTLSMRKKEKDKTP
jgi:Ca2+-binding EF-hand superfamily protein